MSSFFCRFVYGVSFFLFALILIGCGGSEGEDTPRSEWTVEEGALTLEEALHVSDNEDFYFGDIRDVAVDKEGRIYVADGEASHVKVLSPEGRLVEMIGSEGEGPGEFERPTEVVLSHGDSLYVLDGYWGRVSVFAPSGEFEHSFLVRGERGSPSNMMVREESSFLFSYFPSARTVAKEKNARVAFRSARANGKVGDTLFTARMHQTAWRDLDGGGMRFFSLPLLRSSHFERGPEDLIHYAWSNSLGVKAYDADGTVRRTIEVPFEPVPVTEEDRKRVLEGQSGEDRAAIERKIPETKPAFEHFLVDGEGRYWFGRPTAHSDSTAWWVADPDEKRVVTARLLSDVRFFEVQNGFAYGETTTEQGAPALVRYTIRTES